jgi:glycosyltransferase involved in cell wall biosynthesis
MSYLLEEHGIVDVVSIPRLGRELRPLRDIGTAWDLLRIVRRERPAVIHTHKAKAGALGRIVALICRVPVRIHTFHGHVFRGYFSPIKSRLFVHIERLLARCTTCLVVPSERLANELALVYQIAPRRCFEVVPLGFDLDPFARCEVWRGQLRAELALPQTAKLIGIIGRMVPVKDHLTFVRAAEIVARRHAEVHFILVGAGESEPAVRAALASRGLDQRAHLLGWRRDLARICADLDVVALSSLNEGTPVSLIEAMAAGVPVVSTDVGGVADVLREGRRGELVPPNDPQALADGMENALSPGAVVRARRQRSEVVEEYGARRLCRQLEELYTGFLSTGHP